MTTRIELVKPEFIATDVIVDEASTYTTSDATLEYVVNDPSPEQELKMIEQSGVLDFWNDPGEDIYSASDGDPL